MLECSTENASKENLELLRKDVPNNTLLRPFKISSKPISKKLFNIVVSGENISEDNGEIAKVTLNEAKLFCHIISKYLYDNYDILKEFGFNYGDILDLPSENQLYYALNNGIIKTNNINNYLTYNYQKSQNKKYPFYIVYMNSIDRSRIIQREVMNNNSNEFDIINALRNDESPSVIKELVKKVDEVNFYYSVADYQYDITPLHEAAWHSSYPEVIDILLEKGADIHARDQKEGNFEDRDTALQFAAFFNPNVEVLKKLLSVSSNDDHFPIDKNKNNKLTNSALAFAVKANPNPEIIKVLLKHKLYSKKNNDYYTALLCFAVSERKTYYRNIEDYENIFKILQEKGADINRESKLIKELGGYYFRAIPLGEAIKNGNLKAVKALYNSGADFDLRICGREHPIELYTRLFAKLYGIYQEYRNLELFKFLINHCNLNYKDINFIQIAIKNHAYDELEMLLNTSLGEKFDGLKSDEGKSVLAYAISESDDFCEYEPTNSIKILLKHCRNKVSDNKDLKDCLERAINNLNYEEVDYLINEVGLKIDNLQDKITELIKNNDNNDYELWKMVDLLMRSCKG